MASAAESTGGSVQYDVSEEESLSISIVAAIAAARNTDPMSLELSLGEYVDLEALEALYTHSNDQNTTWTVEFAVKDLFVRVQSNGQITVI